MTSDLPAPADTPRLRTPRWPFVLMASFLATGLIVLLLWPVKLPYYAMSPGPVEDVTDLITVTDAATYSSDGSFYLLTVGLREVNAFEWFEARYLDPRVDLLDRDVVRPPGISQEQITRSNLQAMDESIDTAIYVALERLGYDVTFVGEGVEVLQVVDDTPAAGVIEVGDRFDVIDGVAIATADQAAELIRSRAIGDTVVLTGTRGEEPLSVEIILAAHPDVEGAPMVGVVFETVNLALDLLTPGDLTKGPVIAGTGTIRFDETVGAIGGVRQKVFAARAIGVEIIFVPQDNYADALTAAGDGVEIVPVTTLQEALDYLEALEPVPAAVAAG